MHYIIFKPFPVKYGTINLKDHIPSNSHPAEIRDILLGNSFPIYFGKKIHYTIFAHSSVQRICPEIQTIQKCDQRGAFALKQFSAHSALLLQHPCTSRNVTGQDSKLLFMFSSVSCHTTLLESKIFPRP